MFLTLDNSVCDPYTKDLVGGKASNLHSMILDGLNVPPAFVITVDECFNKNFKDGELHDQDGAFYLRLSSYIRFLAEKAGRTWNGPGDPLIVSVRSGAPISMPGMMETVLNIGLTRDNIQQFVDSRSATMTFGLDCYRRLIQMYGVTVDNVPSQTFSSIYDAAVTFYGEDNFSETVMRNLVRLYEAAYEEQTGRPFTDDANEQLLGACNAVFRSWHAPKAVKYRTLENIDHSMGTAVTVQEMVFGNLDERSATGVVFTHDPNTGALGWYGDYLVRAQGEDVVAGTHNTLPIADILMDPNLHLSGRSLMNTIGTLYNKHKTILDIEFTIESGTLWMLQYREAKCARQATVRSLMDMARQGNISSDEATTRFMKLLPPLDRGVADPGSLALLGKGLGATSGVVVGNVAIGHEAALRAHESGEPYIYVAHETAPDDVEQMRHAVGILTASGGLVSHAVLVARAWDKCCVVGFDRIKVVEDGFMFNGEKYGNGSLLKINGESGEVFA